MRRLIAVSLIALLPVAARAQPAPQQTIELPGSTIAAIQNFLLHPPATSRVDPGDVISILEAIAACVSVQVPVDGAIRDSGQCPAVSAAMKRRDAPPMPLSSAAEKPIPPSAPVKP